MAEPQAQLAPSTFAPAFIAVLWAGALEWYRANPPVGLIAVGAMLLGIFFWAFWHRQHLVSQTSFWLGIVLFLSATLGALSFLTTQITLQAVIFGSAFIAWLYLDQATHVVSPSLQGRVAMFVMTGTYFSGVLSLLNLGIFVVQPLWFVLAAGTILYTLIAIIVWLDLEIPWSSFRRVLPWVVWLGAELMLVAWWLPTSVYVGSVVATTIGMLFIHLGRHVWRDTWVPGRGRRYIAIGAGVILLALLTARWF